MYLLEKVRQKKKRKGLEVIFFLITYGKTERSIIILRMSFFFLELNLAVFYSTLPVFKGLFLKKKDFNGILSNFNELFKMSLRGIS